MHLSSLTEIINIENFKVKAILFRTEKIIRLYVEPVKLINPKCSGCGRCHDNIHDSYTIEVEDLPMSGRRVFLVIEKRKTRCCEDHRVRVEEFNWLRGNVTKRFAENIFRLTSITTNQEAGWFLKLDDEKVYRIDKSILEEKAEEKLEPVPEIKNGSVDEVAWQKWHKYITNVIDVDKSLVVWNHNGRGKEVLSGFYKKLGEEKSLAIETMAMDGARGYIEATKECAPQALIVLDKFHIVKKLNETIDEVRKTELRKAREEKNKDLAERLYCGERWLLLKNDLSENQQTRLDELLKLNEPILKAKILKDDFLSIYSNCHSYKEAEETLLEWIIQADDSKLIPFKELAKSFLEKFDYLINYFKRKTSSAISEGFNNKIKRLKRMAYGYRDVDYFLLKIHQHCGLLNPRLST